MIAQLLLKTFLEYLELHSRNHCKQNNEKSGFEEHFDQNRDFRDIPLKIETFRDMH